MRRNFAIGYSLVQKTRILWLPDTEKKVDDMYNHFDRIPAYDRQTHRQTYGQIDILPLHSPRYAYASRGKKGIGLCSRNRHLTHSTHINIFSFQCFAMFASLNVLILCILD